MLPSLSPCGPGSYLMPARPRRESPLHTPTKRTTTATTATMGTTGAAPSPLRCLAQPDYLTWWLDTA